MPPPRRSSVWRCGLIGVGMVLWMDCVTVGVGLRSSQVSLNVLINFLLPSGQDCHSQLQNHVCLQAAMLPVMMITDWTSEL
ncbi:hypothetical protein ACRRTK_007682 [Alexandromys fortis]